MMVVYGGRWWCVVVYGGVWWSRKSLDYKKKYKTLENEKHVVFLTFW